MGSKTIQFQSYKNSAFQSSIEPGPEAIIRRAYTEILSQQKPTAAGESKHISNSNCSSYPRFFPCLKPTCPDRRVNQKPKLTTKTQDSVNINMQSGFAVFQTKHHKSSQSSSRKRKQSLCRGLVERPRKFPSTSSELSSTAQNYMLAKEPRAL